MTFRRRDLDPWTSHFAELAKTCSVCALSCPGNRQFWIDFSICISNEGVGMPGRVDGTRLLIVDDEHHVADTLAKIFQMNGYEVRIAYSAEEGIEAIAQWEPDLALVDVMLPGMNGIEFAVVLKENHPDCRLLLFSGSESAGTLLQEAAIRGHKFDILAKPAHPVELLETVRQLLVSAPGARRLPPVN
jgi:CheY-like chemotaxis protein